MQRTRLYRPASRFLALAVVAAPVIGLAVLFAGFDALAAVLLGPPALFGSLVAAGYWSDAA